MRSLVVYESIFGNTRSVAEAIAEGLSDHGPVTLREVSQAPSNCGEFDLIVLGGPIHAWAMSRPSTREGAREEAQAAGVEPVSKGIGVREWLEGLDRADPGQAAAAFDTAVHVPKWLPQGSAARPEARRLERLGYRVIAPPEHFYVEDKDGPLEAGERDRARTWGHWLAVDEEERGQPPVFGR